MHVRRSFARVLGSAVLAAVTLLPTAAHAEPIGDVHEGGGYAVLAAHGAVAACQSTASYVPTGAGGVALGAGPCAGTLAVPTGVVVEAFTPDGAQHLANGCSSSPLCTLTVPAGWGVFWVLTSSFWTPDDSTWLVMNNVNNDGYCNASGAGWVCRAWATGVS